MSNLAWFKYELIWDKEWGTTPFLVKLRPNKSHENILIFYNKQCTYNPIKNKLKKESTIGRDKRNDGAIKARGKLFQLQYRGHSEDACKYPETILVFPSYRVNNQFQSEILHNTQKPVALFEYLVNTYTNEGDLVLDNCIGSGTTAVACIKTNRHYIGIELDEAYCKIAQQRIDAENAQLKLDFSMAGG